MKSTQNLRTNSIHSIDYRPEIDGLRALAVTLVILVHAFPNYLQNGYIGVDIFFVISGFLITGILLSQLQAGSFSLRGFYVRRANRIFPALILVLIACAGFGWLSLYADEYKLLGRAIAASAGFAANINFFLEGGYWDIAGTLKPLLHLWSLGVEEQFYLLWPLLLWSAWTRRFNIAAVLIGIISMSLAWNLRTTATDQSAAFYLPFSRFWELLAGGALAYVGIVSSGEPSNEQTSPTTLASRLLRYIHASATLSNVCAFLGVGLIAAALIQDYPPEQFPGWHAILPVLGAVLIIAAGSNAWVNSRVFSHRWVVYVGLISYPLYVWHWPLLTFGRILGNGELSAEFRNVALLLTVVLAVATYHLVEKPIRLNPGRRGLKALILASLLVVCGAAGYSIFARNGLEARYNTFSDVKVARPAPNLGGDFKIALLGDSQAQIFSYYLPISPSRLVTFGTAGWPHLVGTISNPDAKPQRPPDEPKLTDGALARIGSDPTIQVVVIAHMYNLYTGSDYLRSYPYRPNETSAMAYYKGLRRTVKVLTDAGKKVVYVKSIPFLGGVVSVMACSSAVLPVQRKQPKDCLLPLADVRKFREGYDEAVQHALGDLPGVSTFDPMPFLCDDRYCYVEKDGIVMYQNTSHLSPIGSYLVGSELLKYLERLRVKDE